MAIENTIPSSLQDVLASQENARIDRDKQHQEEMTTMRNILIQQRNNHPSSSSSTSSSERNTEHKNINVLKQSTLDLNMSCSEFIVWRESWTDYKLLIKMYTSRHTTSPFAKLHE